MVPNKINKEKLKQSQQANTPSPKASRKKEVKSSDENSTKKLQHANANDNDDELKAMVGGCCVCADDTGFSNNLLVYCDGCDVAVHQGCYGIFNVPEGDWFCRRCEFKQKNDGRIDKISCQLCPSKEGAIKRTDTNKWAHVVCALFIPEISFGSNRSMEPIILKDINLDRLDKKCSICEVTEVDNEVSDQNSNSNQVTGTLTSLSVLPSSEVKSYTNGQVYVNCNKPGCKDWFHVTCAQSKGLLCEDHSVSQNNVTYCIYCRVHYSKLTSSDIKRIPPFITQNLPSVSSQTQKPSSQPKQSKRKSLNNTCNNKDQTSDKPKKNRTNNDSVNKDSDSKSDSKSKTASRPSRSNSLNNSSSDLNDTNICSKKSTNSEAPKSGKKQKLLVTNSPKTFIKTEKVDIEPKENIKIKSADLKVEKPKKKPDTLPMDIIKVEKNLPHSATSNKLPKKEEIAEVIQSTPISNNLLMTIPVVQSTPDKIDSIMVQTNMNLISDISSRNEQIDKVEVTGNTEIVNKINESVVELKPESKSCNVASSSDEIETNKRKLRGSSSGDCQEYQILSNQLNTPSSSYSSSSSTYSNKSPKRQRKSHLDFLPNPVDTKPSTPVATDLLLPAIPQATTPLTPPPSVTQENFMSHTEQNTNLRLDALHTNHPRTSAMTNSNSNLLQKCANSVEPKELQLNQIVVKSAKSENFKQPKLCIEKSKRLELLLPEAKSRKDEKVNNMNDSGDNEEDEDDMEFPKTLEELLKKQWTLGADMIAEQSEKFEVMGFLSLLNDCKRENELLEKKLSDLESTYSYMSNLNEKLQQPLNNNRPDNKNKPSKLETEPQTHHQKQQIFQPIPTNASASHLCLPKTPTKQTAINSLLISASPISSASSPNNSSLQNISFEASSNHPQKSSVIKNNTINNTSINNNINLISQSDSCFYNLNSINKLNGLKHLNMNYANGNNTPTGNTTTESSLVDMANSTGKFSSPTHHSQGQHHNPNQYIVSALNDLSKNSSFCNTQNSTSSKNMSNSQMTNTNHHQQQLQHPLFNLNPYQQQIYYAYLMQQQQSQPGSNPINFPEISHMISSLNSVLPSSSNNTNSNANSSSNNASKSVANLSKEILESTLSNMIS